MPDLHHSISIKADRGVVHRLVSDGDGLKQWWAEDVTIEPDGIVDLGFFDRATVYRLRLEGEEPERVVWRCETGREWRDTRLIFTIEPEPHGVRVDFLHADWRDATPYFASCNTTWGALLFRLKAAAEGSAPGPLFRKRSLAS